MEQRLSSSSSSSSSSLPAPVAVASSSQGQLERPAASSAFEEVPDIAHALIAAFIEPYGTDWDLLADSNVQEPNDLLDVCPLSRLTMSTYRDLVTSLHVASDEGHSDDAFVSLLQRYKHITAMSIVGTDSFEAFRYPTNNRLAIRDCLLLDYLYNTRMIGPEAAVEAALEASVAHSSSENMQEGSSGKQEESSSSSEGQLKRCRDSSHQLYYRQMSSLTSKPSLILYSLLAT